MMCDDSGAAIRSRLWLGWRAAAVAVAISFGTGSMARADELLTRVVGGLTFDQFIEVARQDYGVPGAVVVVARANGTVFLKGYGVRRLGSAEPVDGDTRFQLASVSKFITATAVGTLVDRGVVSWDRAVRTFSPETELAVPYASENATLRDYLAHRTGLPAYAGDLLTQLGYDATALSARARFLAFDHSFRSAWAYSNYGIFLGQQAAAHAAGLTPGALLSTAILEPLGMTRSGPVRATLSGDDNRAAAHDLDGTVMSDENVDAFSGAGAVVSTGRDLGRWMQMLLAEGQFAGRTVLAKGTVGEIFAASMVQGPGGPLQDPNDSAGLGCESYRFGLGRVIEKNGALNGIRTIVTLIPERGVGIAVLANKQLTVFPEAVRAAFLERELGPSGRDLQADIRAQQPAWQALLDVPRAPVGAAALSNDLDAFIGRYSSPLYGAVAVTRHGGALDVAIGPAGYPGHLSHWSGDTFLLRFDNPDVAPGLLTFTFASPVVDGEHRMASGADGSVVPGLLTVDYGHFARVAGDG